MGSKLLANTPTFGNMVRNDRDEWEKDEPVGVFDIESCNILEYPEATARIIFICPNRKQCAILLGLKAVERTKNGRLNIWRWDGSFIKPTITPSINCIAEKDGKPTGGCGWHGFICQGVIK